MMIAKVPTNMISNAQNTESIKCTPTNRHETTTKICQIPINAMHKFANYSATVTPDGEDSVDLLSVVATPTPRHKGHALRPEANHYLSTMFHAGIT
jgi:hypothetical protein